MCGRLSLAASTDAVLSMFGLPDASAAPAELATPRYNIAPTDPLVALRLDREGGPHLATMRRGLVPHWTQQLKGPPLINARAETAASKPSFRDAFARRRCLIPSDGFYEWERRGKERQPYRFCLADDAPMAFAGLWARWRTPEGEVLDSATILTVAANATVAPLHDRMPAIIPAEAFDAWLRDEPDRVQALLQPAPADLLRSYPVGKQVNKVRNDGPALWRQIDPDAGPPLPLFDD